MITALKNYRRIFSQNGGGGTGAGLNYKGLWDANANSPVLTSGVGTQGDYYVVGTAGNTNLDGITDWAINDWAIFNGTDWQKIDNSEIAYVPYTGATSDVNLGEFGIQLGNLEFDNTPTNIPTNAGSLVWNDTDGTLDLKLKGGNVTLQIGQETVVRVVNKTATNVTLLQSNYQAVRITGAQGLRPKVDLAQATNDILSAETIGLVTETILNNEEGFINTSGLVRGLNTTGSLQSETWADGDILYLSPTIAGNVTNIKPIAPNHLIIIGYVISAHITQGTIFVKVDNGYELNELHNVLINGVANNDALIYESATQLWKNKTIPTALGYTPVTDTRNLTINGTTANLSADRTFTVTDANLSTSDITTNDVSTTKHGFAPKLPNDATKYLDGTGNYSTPAGGGGGDILQFQVFS